MEKGKKIITLLFLAVIIGFSLLKVYVLFFETNFHDLNAENIKKVQEGLDRKTDYSFIVIGNVDNSIDVFDDRILPLINKDDADFVIFAGDSVMDYGEDKYGALYKTLEQLNKPFILAVGNNEVSTFGYKNFYNHFGPYYFSFALDDSYFIFLDTSGQTSEEWQRVWLLKELKSSESYSNRFVVMNRPVFEDSNRSSILHDRKYKMSSGYRDFLKGTFGAYNVTAVFSSTDDMFKKNQINGTEYIATGGGGGISISDIPNAHYNFVKVTVSQDAADYRVVELPDTESSVFLRFWKTIWFQLHSWFYVTYVNFILVSSILFLIIYLIYTKLIDKKDYYPRFSHRHKTKKKLSIVMFTNNYLPFIGGVAISIARLKKGLEKKGHRVYVFAPRYSKRENDSSVIRCRPLFCYKKRNFVVPVTNIFSTKIKKRFLEIKPDVVHIHHPYWLGSVGLRLAKKSNIPAVYTYHTRIEQYNHYLPLFRDLAGGKLPHMLIKHFANSCDGIIAPTKTAKAYLRNLGVGKTISVMPTGVDLDNYNVSGKETELLAKEYRRDGEILLISVFRLSKEKNPYFMLDGIRQIRDRTNIRFRCLIAGDGPEEKNIRKYIDKNRLGDIVTLLGKVSPEELPKYYMISDIFIFTSKSETQGMVLLEAMAGSCPVVAIQSSGVDDIIMNNKNGFKTRDRLADWADRIIYLMKNEDARKRLSKEAHEFSKKFSTESIAGKSARLYQKLINEK